MLVKLKNSYDIVYGHRNSCKNKSEQILYKHFNLECKFKHAQFRRLLDKESNVCLSI